MALLGRLRGSYAPTRAPCLARCPLQTIGRRPMFMRPLPRTCCVAPVASGKNRRKAARGSHLELVKLPEEAKPPKIELAEDQENAVRLALSEERPNIILTGSAGTGKTVVLNEVKSRLSSKLASEYSKRVAVTAMTGIAATHVGGVTIHSLLCLGRLEQFRNFFNILQKSTALDTLYELDTLILDEMSMMSAEMLQGLDATLTKARKQAAERARLSGTVRKDMDKERLDRPFGGLQLVLCGDFFQLGPIEGKGRHSADGGPKSAPLRPLEQTFLNRGYLFEAPVYEYGGFKVVHLTKVFRQSDASFQSDLMTVRCGGQDKYEKVMEQLVRDCSRPLDESDGIKATILYGKNFNVDEENNKQLQNLSTPEESFIAQDTVAITFEPPAEHDTRKWRLDAQHYLKNRDYGLFAECQAADKVQLKVGAQVMLLRNLDVQAGLVNGSRGVVVGFKPASMSDYAWQQPLATLEKSLRLKPVLEALDSWYEENGQVPVVKFANGKEIEVAPTIFTQLLPGVGARFRVQTPLRLAWALTVHKSQGMTLDKVIVDLSTLSSWQGAWHGVVYTALSRVRNKEGLQLIGTAKRTIDERVLRWSEGRRAPAVYRTDPGSDSRWLWEMELPDLSRPKNAAAEEWFRNAPHRQLFDGSGGESSSTSSKVEMATSAVGARQQQGSSDEGPAGSGSGSSVQGAAAVGAVVAGLAGGPDSMDVVDGSSSSWSSSSGAALLASGGSAELGPGAAGQQQPVADVPNAVFRLLARVDEEATKEALSEPADSEEEEKSVDEGTSLLTAAMRADDGPLSSELQGCLDDLEEQLQRKKGMLKSELRCLRTRMWVLLSTMRAEGL
ncbi:hypothetical protein Agub_g4272 [Astrephomene gubernaculifera]|uniref:ATP-dependent DNA helicase n=1 Tax=Astrephomene gubernaculifera TaxID=47775 RepID=A0AAD3HJQ5_9CHLO|nr:hypothetical protein Agub_g4272 [Astrephomene gubernaculifera]